MDAHNRVAKHNVSIDDDLINEVSRIQSLRLSLTSPAAIPLGKIPEEWAYERTAASAGTLADYLCR